MYYLVIEGSVPENLSKSCEEVTQGEFTIAYSRDIEVEKEEKATYIFQGLISNREELKEHISVESEDDVELFQRCYEKNSEILNKIDGFYTAIIVKNNQIEVFRDIFGSKPVYYSQKNDSIVLSSNIQPVLDTEPELREVNRQVAADYLANGLVDHRRETFFQRLKRLKPREKLVYDGSKIELEETGLSSTDREVGLKKAVEGNIEKLKPEGSDYYCPVSGGLDSTVVASKCRDAKHIHLSFGHGTKDKEYLPSVKSEYELDIQKVEVKPIDLLEEVETTVKAQEEPTAFPAVQAQSILYDSIEDGKVVIAGSGSDELFFGYSWFLPFYLADKLRDGRLIRFLRKLVEYRESLDLSHLRGLTNILMNGATSIPVSAQDFINAESEPLQISTLEEAKNKHLDSFYFPHILRSVEKNSQNRHVEVRSAFLSKKLLELSHSKEPGDYFQNGLSKYLLRSEFKEELPEKVYSRKQKTGFVFSSSNLYTKPVVEELIRVLGSESFQNRELIKSKKVVNSLKKGYLPFELAYRFYVYELWMQEFLD